MNKVVALSVFLDPNSKVINREDYAELMNKLEHNDNLYLIYDKIIIGKILHLICQNRSKHLEPLIVFQPENEYECVLTNYTLDTFLEYTHDVISDDKDLDDKEFYNYYLAEKEN